MMRTRGIQRHASLRICFKGTGLTPSFTKKQKGGFHGETNLFLLLTPKRKKKKKLWANGLHGCLLCP